MSSFKTDVFALGGNESDYELLKDASSDVGADLDDDLEFDVRRLRTIYE